MLEEIALACNQHQGAETLKDFSRSHLSVVTVKVEGVALVSKLKTPSPELGLPSSWMWLSAV